MTVGELLDRAAARLAGRGVENPRGDARLLLQHVLGVGHAAIIAAMRDEAGARAEAGLAALVDRRAGGEPVSRIVGRRAFFGLEFEITPDVLDPRPETELLVECALERAPTRPFRFADIGTGSGAIAVSILVARQDATCQACDISQAALAVAIDNARRHGVAARFEPVRGDYLGGVTPGVDFIVSNPPYIETAAIAGLSPEVRLHDPALALDGGADGLDAYRRLLDGGAGLPRPGGWMHLEVGAGQGDAVAQMAARRGWIPSAIHADIAGIGRVVSLRRPDRA